MTATGETEAPGDDPLSVHKQRLALFIESVADYAFFTIDVDSLITSWNVGAERLLGWREHEVIGRSARIVFTPEDRADGAPEREMSIARRTGSAADERVHIRKDGSRFWATGRLMAIPAPDGTHRGYAKIMRDDTQRRLAQESLEKALGESEAHRAAAEEANRVKDEFISTVSHELRTPLNNIRLWARILSSGKLPHHQWQTGITVIERAAIAQQQLIEDLLDASRIESGKLRVTKRPARLVEVVGGAIESLQPMLESRNLQIGQSLSADLGVVNVDAERIQQVVCNLLANAIKFTPDGGRIRVSADRAGDDVELWVEDTGEGIAAEFVPHVFERFRQGESAPSTRSHSGLGLGLAIAKQLVELHEGSISAASEGRGRGARFTVRLPLPRLQERSLEHADAVRAGKDRLHGVAVLLIEDDSATRDAMRRLLEIDGASVRVAGTADEARAAWLEDPPDLVLCDIGLPEEDGLSWMRWLRRTERELQRKRVPAVAVTAFARPEDERSALAAGFDTHIAKPVDESRLVASIVEAVQDHVA